MNRFFYLTNYITTYDQIYKFNSFNLLKIPRIEKIILNIGTIEKNNIILLLLFLEIISLKKSSITKSKKNRIKLRLKKNIITGCKVILEKNQIFIFLEKIILFFFTKVNNFKGVKIKFFNNSILTFHIKNIFNFFELNDEYIKFQKIKNLSISITIFTRINCYNNFKFLLTSLNFPIKKKQN